MLLQSLIDHGRTQNETATDYYLPRQIHWIVSLNIDPSERPEVIDNRGTKDDPPRYVTVPYKVRAGQKPDAFLLVDNATFVFAVPKTDSETKKPSTDEHEIHKARERRDRYVLLVRQLIAAHPELPESQAIEQWLDHPLPAPDDMLSADNIAIQVDSIWVHDLPEARRFWAETIRASKATTTGVCLNCGTDGPLLSSLPTSVKGIPGAGMNTPLISVNQPAHYRAGTKQLGATPLCESCGTTAVNTLNTLLATHEHRRRNLNTVTVWWTREPAPTDIVHAALDDPTPELAAHLHDTIHDPQTGRAALSFIDPNDFYAATLGVNRSRVVLRDWIDVPLPILKARLAAWLDDHRTWNGWTNTDDYYSVWRLSLAAARYDPRKKQYVDKTTPHGLDEDLVRCALHGAPPPAALLPVLLQRIHADRHVDQPRCALLRLILTRATPRDEGTCMPRLNPDAEEPGYVCGRIFAMLEAIQLKAMPKVNATIADRYRRTAMTSPGTILPMLWEGSGNHLRSIKNTDRAAAAAMNTRLEQTFALLSDTIPAQLTMRDQARFVIGYAHQKQADIEAAHTAKAAKAAKDKQMPAEKDSAGEANS